MSVSIFSFTSNSNFQVPNNPYYQMIIELWGGGGGGAGASNVAAGPGNIGGTSFITTLSLNATGGNGASLLISGVGGTASGGTINISGNTGGTGGNVSSGAGGDSPQGGSGGHAVSPGGINSGNPGNPGGQPGGGGSGAAYEDSLANKDNSPGGGGGSYCQKVYNFGTLSGTLTCNVGRPGLGGSSDRGMVGGQGANGLIQITIVHAPILINNL